MSAFVALDVETANGWTGSICQIGLVEYDGEGNPPRRRSLLVDCRCDIAPINYSIHGISRAQLRGAPDFATLWPEVRDSLHGRVVVSHTGFDGRAILSACHAAGVDLPQARWVDSCAAARHAWPELPNHKLNTLMDALGYSFRHHDAEQDALAASLVFVRAVRDIGMPLEAAFARFAYRPSPSGPGAARSQPRYPRQMTMEPLAKGCLAGHVVVITGPTQRDREELAMLAASLGAQVRTAVTGRTTLLISAWGAGEGSGKLAQAHRRRGEGQDIRVLSEAEFDAMIL